MYREFYLLPVAAAVLIFIILISEIYQLYNGNGDIQMETIWRGARLVGYLLIGAVISYFAARPKYLKFLKFRKKDPSK